MPNIEPNQIVINQKPPKELVDIMDSADNTDKTDKED